MLKDNLLMLRGIHGFSQEEIAERVGISRQAYAKWESGATIPDVEKCARLAREYGTTVDALLRTEEMDDGRVLPPRAKGQEHMGLRVRERAWPDRHPEGGARPLRPSRGPEAHPRERRQRGVRPDPGRDLRAEDRAHEPDPVPCRRVRREGGERRLAEGPCHPPRACASPVSARGAPASPARAACEHRLALLGWRLTGGVRLPLKRGALAGDPAPQSAGRHAKPPRRVADPAAARR